METWRMEQIRLVETTLPGPEQPKAICRINQRVARWKIEHPELVRDEVPF